MRRRTRAGRHIVRSHWQDRVEVALGLWLVASPSVLGASLHAGIWSAIVAGVLVVTLAIDAFYYPEAIEERGSLVTGVLLALSPWLLGYASETRTMANAVVCGIAIAALSFWTVEEIDEAQQAAARDSREG